MIFDLILTAWAVTMTIGFSILLRSHLRHCEWANGLAKRINKMEADRAPSDS